jgi:hypothetical protein
MNMAILKYVFGAGAACVLAISFTNPSNAFPILTNTATVKSSVPSLVTDARYYGRGYGGRYHGRSNGYGGAAAAGIIGGLAAGAIIGSAAANNGYYYGPGPYAYDAEPYAYAPAPAYRGYYGGGGNGGCWPCY